MVKCCCAKLMNVFCLQNERSHLCMFLLAVLQIFRFTFSCKLELASYRISVFPLPSGNFQNCLVNDFRRTLTMQQLWITYSCSYMWYKMAQPFCIWSKTKLSYLIKINKFSSHSKRSLLMFLLSSLPLRANLMNSMTNLFPTWNGVRSKASFHRHFLILLWSSCPLLFNLHYSLKIDYIYCAYINIFVVF